MTTRPLFEMPDSPAADEHFRHLPHFDSGLDARVDVDLFESILKARALMTVAEHAHVICGNAVEALRAGREAAKDVAAADNDGDLDTEGVNVLDLAGDAADDLRIDAEALIDPSGLRR